MSRSEYENFQIKLAYHSAPTLYGVKPANLFTVKKDEFSFERNKELNDILSTKGIFSRILCEINGRYYILIYNKKLLSKILKNKERCKILSNAGYECSLDETICIDKMLDRLSQKILENADFPHEIGVFLGYPTDDILGYIENNGKNFKICGFWKVYGNVEEANRLFTCYARCRDYLCEKINGGLDIFRALKIC